MQIAKLASFYPVTVDTYKINELVDMFLTYCDSAELSKKTIPTWRSHLNALLRAADEMDFSDVTQIPIDFFDAFFAYSRQTLSKSTLNTRKRVVRVFLTWLRDYKEIPLKANPEFIHIHKDAKPKPKAICRAIVQRVIDECPNYQDKLLITTFVETGMRNAEISIFRVSNIDYDCITIMGKGLKERKVYITHSLAEALKEYTAGKNRNAFVFTNKHQNLGGQLDTRSIWRHVKKHFKEIAGIDIYPHMLRHTFALNLLQNGCDIVTIKELLGHDDINTTMVYLQQTDQKIKQNYQKHIGKPLLS